MADWVNLLMLVCACIGSMAFGILAAYAILRTAFGWMGRSQRPAVIKVRSQVARVS